jgi:hypothetical protein
MKMLHVHMYVREEVEFSIAFVFNEDNEEPRRLVSPLPI